MFNNVSIRTKGILLVLVPLIAQLVFIFLLTSLVRQAESQIEEIEKARVVIERANYVLRKVLDATTAAGGYSYTGNVMFREGAQRSTNEAMAAYKNLARDLPQTTDKKQLIAETTNLTKSWQRVVNGFVKKIEEGDTSFLNDVQSFYRAGEVVGRLGSNFDTLLGEQHKLTEQSASLKATSKKRVLTLLWLGLVSNISITIALSLFFSRQISNRLSVLMKKSSNLANGVPIGQPLGGKDEIARLDKVFHDMVSSLEEADRKRAEFVSVVSHELKSPLTAAHGTISLFQEGAFGEVSEKGERRLKALAADLSRLIVLINELLDAERLESGQFDLHIGKVDLARVFDRADISVGNLAEMKDIHIVIPEECRISVEADEDRLVQVMINLLSNAIKFSPANSSIEIYLSLERSGFVTIVVADHGYGIPEEKLEKIFERYTRVKRETVVDEGGSGLGLFISKALIDAMSGTIRAESDTTGSRFYVELPAVLPLSSGE